MQKHLIKISLGVLVLVCGVSSCNGVVSTNQPLPTESVQTSNSSQKSNSTQFNNLEKSVHQQINQYRQSQNLPSLSWDETIAQQARVHSQAMASGAAPFSHKGFEERINSIKQSIPYRSAAENLAYNQGYSNPDQQAVAGWLESPGHLKNIQGDFNLTGVGITKNSKDEYYFTQIFLKRP